jgi:hypothetical protein
MGGFMLFEVGKACRIIDPEDLKSLSDSDKIDFSKITETEIQDKSKSDGLAKWLVVIQTGWFTLQCIARGVQHLPITELEIITLAFAMLNFLIYALLWDKPLNVRCPVRVLSKGGLSRGECGDRKTHREDTHERDSTAWYAIKQVFHVVVRKLRTAIWVVADNVDDPIRVFICLGTVGDDFESESKRVPTFCVGKLGDDEVRYTYIAGGLDDLRSCSLYRMVVPISIVQGASALAPVFDNYSLSTATLFGDVDCLSCILGYC